MIAEIEFIVENTMGIQMLLLCGGKYRIDPADVVFLLGWFFALRQQPIRLSEKQDEHEDE